MSAQQTSGCIGDGDFARPVLVLAKHPADYEADCRAAGLEPLCAASMRELLEVLKERAVSGFVFEVDEVLHAGRPLREHVFHLAEAFPLLRALRHGADGQIAFLDDPETFVTQVQRFFPRRARLAPRSPVLLEALLAPADGPAQAEPAEPERAVILDVSSTGGLIMGGGVLEPGHLVHLRIPTLSDSAPITAGVCWSGGGKGCRRRAGVRFMEIRPGQARELAEQGEDSTA